MPIITPFKLEDLVGFLFRAREQGFAGSAKKVPNPQRPGFTEFAPYSEGPFEYVDSYAGHYYAPGQEVVRFNGIPVWNMAYNGGMLPEHHRDLELSGMAYGFLRKALSRIQVERPFRGPEIFAEGDFTYTDESSGDITRFKGTERIFFVRKPVFKQDYIGGLIVHKE